MDNDDRQVGRILSRREVLALFGAAGAAFLAACMGLDETASPTIPVTQTAGEGPAIVPTAVPTQGAAAPAATEAIADTGALPACVVRPEQTEGPYFVDEMLDRSDIRSDPSTGEVKEGVPLQINFKVSQIGNNACTPLAGATVDVWHCDALGVYSDVQDPGFNTAGQKFLRGTQVTDETGAVQFTTIYPGWYQGRTVHIHFKIRTDPSSETGYEFTSQLYFDDALSDQIHNQEPYAGKGQRTLRNEGDRLFQDGGDQLLLQPTESNGAYTATFDIGLQMT
jgi:protocatechuate 3,4-dioxygenase beta subunit